QPIKLPPVEVTPEKRAALEKRLGEFATAAKNNQPAEITLSIEELNVIIAIAPDTGYGSYSDLVRITSTWPEKNAIRGNVCLPLNNMKFWEDKKRYLIGEITFFMHIHEEGLD